MDSIDERLATLQNQYHQLADELLDQVQQINSLRIELLELVNKASSTLKHRINRPPGVPTSHYWRVYREHWRSFELFTEKLDVAYQQLSTGFDLESGVLDSPGSNDEAQWADTLDEMEELLDILKIGKQQRFYLLSAIELVDSTNRLLDLSIPRFNGKGLDFQDALQTAKHTTRDIREALNTALYDNDVKPIELSVGQYPPPDTTRIISRTDNNTDDNVAITEIVTNGYTWQGKLLRKADVIVMTKPGE